MWSKVNSSAQELAECRLVRERKELAGKKLCFNLHLNEGCQSIYESAKIYKSSKSLVLYDSDEQIM